MKALKFTLSGDHAFFKDNVLNTIYLTYGNIHKIALLGIFGAIIGLGGYNQQSKQLTLDKNRKYNDYPEFYEKLKNLKISVIPNSENGTFSKKMQSFNNSVGYASQEQGNNLIVNQYWLENPSWDIVLMLDSEYSQKIADYIINYKTVYIPYLGANNHFANIENAEVIDIEELKTKEAIQINSYVLSENIKLELNPIISQGSFKYQEYLPFELDQYFNKYILKKVMVTDYLVKNQKDKTYKAGEYNIVFY